jgi:hypothetical protein
LGQTQLGIYRDEYEDIHPDTLNQYYGVHGKPRRVQNGQIGAGHSDDESDNDSIEDLDLTEDLAGCIADHQKLNIRHEAINPPPHNNPFQDDTQDLFFRVIAEVIEQDIIPLGYHLLPVECEDGIYPLFEEIKIGRKGKNEVQIDLSDPIWQQRAILWVQALDVLSHFNNT